MALVPLSIVAFAAGAIVEGTDRAAPQKREVFASVYLALDSPFCATEDTVPVSTATSNVRRPKTRRMSLRLGYAALTLEAPHTISLREFTRMFI